MRADAFVLAVVASLASLPVVGCSSTQTRGSSGWQVRFGPVVTGELIVGRAIAGPVAWILTASDALVRVDLGHGTFSRSSVHPLSAEEHVWGLAMGDGRMWTLLGRSVLAQIRADGFVVQRIPLAEPHVGVFGTGTDLVYQVMNFQPPADALSTGPPGEFKRKTWGRMRTRALPLTRTAVAALNLVSCGPTGNGTIPCWFPDEPAVTLTYPSGESRGLTLDGLPTVAPEILLASDNPQRPIRDSFVDESGDLWILGSGQASDPPDSERRGGWLLARYDGNGRLVRRTRLSEPARLLLNTRKDGGCLLLTWDGHVVEVHQ